MSRPTQFARSAFSFLLIISLYFAGFSLPFDDLVPTDDITGSASVFVFRGSSKRPQARSASVRLFIPTGGRGQANRAKVANQVAVNRKRKTEQSQARAAALARARARERNARYRQSNVLTARAETQLASGEIETAIVNFREALKFNAKNSDAATGLSEALTAKGIETAGDSDNENAIVLFEEAVKLNDHNEIAYAKLGEIHDAHGRNDQAVVNYEKALTIDPEFSSLFLPLGLAFLEADKFVEAETYLTKAEGAGADGPEFRFGKAVIFIRQGRGEEALTALERIVADDPRNAPAFYQIGLSHDHAGRIEKATESYLRAVEIDNTLSDAWFNLGVIYYNAGEYAKASDAYLRVLERDGENARARANLASTYRQLERYAEANAQYRDAEAGIKNDPDLYSEWGYCLGKTNEWDKSVARLNTASELSPTAVDNNNVGWGYYNAGRTDKANENDEEAARKFELAKLSLQKAVELDPQLDAAQLNLGATNNSLGDFAAAIAALNIALGLRGNWVIAMNQLGIAFRGSNDLPSAIQQFTRVTTLDGNNRFGLYSLGEVYFLSGNKKEAKKVRDRLNKVDPAMASRLDNVLSGKIVLDDAKRKINTKVPRIPRIPF